MRKLWRFRRPSRTTLISGALLIVGGIGGILFWGGFHTAMEYTNRLEFCVSCHDMNTVYEEYKQSVHYTNASGVRAVCSDCHVPREWLPKVIRKIYATNELYHHLLGTIDTPEEFQGARLELARHVWKTMEENDSHECRNCHAFTTMDFHKQSEKASTAMQKAMTDGSTCIDCHKGIAHKLPDMTQGFKQMIVDLMQSSPDAAEGDVLYTVTTRPVFLDRPDGQPAEAGDSGDGKLLSASEVKVLEHDGDWLKVRIEGWQQEGAERALNALMGKRMLTVALAPAAVEKIQTEESITDPDTALVWRQAAIEAWISDEALVADQEALWAYGAEMFNSTCAVCHKLPLPGHFLANQWIGVLNAMKRFTSLNEEQYRFLQKYLQFHAQDVAGESHG